MDERKCAECGKTFAPRNQLQRYCKKECVNAAKRQSYRNFYAAQAHKPQLSENMRKLREEANAATAAGLSYGKYVGRRAQASGKVK